MSVDYGTDSYRPPVLERICGLVRDQFSVPARLRSLITDLLHGLNESTADRPGWSVQLRQPLPWLIGPNRGNNGSWNGDLDVITPDFTYSIHVRLHLHESTTRFYYLLFSDRSVYHYQTPDITLTKAQCLVRDISSHIDTIAQGIGPLRAMAGFLEDMRLGSVSLHPEGVFLEWDRNTPHPGSWPGFHVRAIDHRFEFITLIVPPKDLWGLHTREIELLLQLQDVSWSELRAIHQAYAVRTQGSMEPQQAPAQTLTTELNLV